MMMVCITMISMVKVLPELCAVMHPGCEEKEICEKNFQKSRKNFKKGIDKGDGKWYNMQAVSERRSQDNESTRV